jgi:hypothetical protein
MDFRILGRSRSLIMPASVWVMGGGAVIGKAGRQLGMLWIR